MPKPARKRQSKARPRYLEALIAILRFLAAIIPFWQLWRR